MSTITVRSESGDKRFDCESGITLLDLLSAEGFPISAPCGGQGKCGKCAVTLVSPDGKRERVAREERDAGGESAVAFLSVSIFLRTEREATADFLSGTGKP